MQQLTRALNIANEISTLISFKMNSPYIKAIRVIHGEHPSSASERLIEKLDAAQSFSDVIYAADDVEEMSKQIGETATKAVAWLISFASTEGELALNVLRMKEEARKIMRENGFALQPKAPQQASSFQRMRVQ